MRIRITQRLSGSIDGIQLERFAPGCLYDVGTSLASCLLALGAAEPVLDDTPALITPLGDQMARPPASLKHAATARPALDKAADQIIRRTKRHNDA